MSRLIHRCDLTSEYKTNTKFHRSKMMHSPSLFQQANVNSVTPSLKKPNINTVNQICCGSHRGQRREEGHKNCEKINICDTGTCLIPPKRAVGSKGLLPGSILSSDAEVMQIIYTHLQSHNHLHLHFCFSAKAVRYLLLVHVSPSGLLPQPADKGCPSAKGDRIFFLKKREIQIPSDWGH